MIYNTFNNISAISSRPISVMKEAEYPESTTNHGQATGKLYHLRLRVECTFFYFAKPGANPRRIRCTRLAAASDKVYQLLAHGWWYSPGTPLLSSLKLVVMI
jgi:hypothetical protein